VTPVVGIVLADLALIVALALLCAGVAKRLRQPAVMGEIVAGLLLGPSLLGLFPGDLPRVLFPPVVRPYLEVLAQVGLVLFMFGVGYRLDTFRLRGHGTRVLSVSVGSVALPFGLGLGTGFATFGWLNRTELAPTSAAGPALFLGAAMSITAFPVLARIVAERGLEKTSLGVLAIASAAVQDLLAWCTLAVVVALVTASGPWSLALTFGLSLLFLAVLVLLVRPALRWLLSPNRVRGARTRLTHAVLLSGLLISAWATDAIGLHALFGAFAFGAVVPRQFVEVTSPHVTERIDQASLLLLPVFFTITGMTVDLGGLGGQGVAMLLGVVVVACVGKFGGAVTAAKLSGVPAREAVGLGVLLNARGLTELVILNVGLQLRMIDHRMFTVMVAMAVITTLITGPLLSMVRVPAAEAPGPAAPVVRVRAEPGAE
jgi:Kef-type K+ transport system membrane component KefB